MPYNLYEDYKKVLKKDTRDANVLFQFKYILKIKKFSILVNFCSLVITCVLIYFSVDNPCELQNGGCDHICVLSHTSDNNGLGYKCLCDPGYSITVDGKTCERRFLL